MLSLSHPMGEGRGEGLSNGYSWATSETKSAPSSQGIL